LNVHDVFKCVCVCVCVIVCVCVSVCVCVCVRETGWVGAPRKVYRSTLKTFALRVCDCMYVQ